MTDRAGLPRIEHMSSIGWHNQHETITRSGDRLVLAGVDDPTGVALPDHGPDLSLIHI